MEIIPSFAQDAPISASPRRPHPKATVARQILALLERVMDRVVDPESRPCGSCQDNRSSKPVLGQRGS